MIKFTQKGDFHKLQGFLEKSKEFVHKGNLDRYGQMGVSALRDATPKDSGLTANSWYYEIINKHNELKITWNNSNVNDGENIAILIQYGHGTGWGGYVVGTDYINPALKPIFEQIADQVWKEVTSV